MGCALLALSFIVLSFFRPVIPAGEDALVAGEVFGVDDTLVSLGKTFAFGFFKPGNSKNQYLGIWYNKIPGETVIWIANRENPVTDASGVLAIAAGGNLLLSDGSGKTLWSSNVSLEILAGKNTSAVLQESGNLALMDEREFVLWQSFDSPTDTYLPGMKFRLNLTSGETRGLVSWRDAGDPSRGEYSVRLDPLWPAQLLLSKGSTRLWRSTGWNGRVSTELLDNGRNYASYLTVVASKDEMTLTMALSDASLVSRIVLNRSGLVSQLTWAPEPASWDVVWTRPSIPCHFYAHCGPFGMCNRNKNPECECLEGFKPKSKINWENGNFSEGCVRRIEEKCNEGDGFQRLVKIKLPDLPTSFNNLNITQCQSQCLKNCSCEAFSYANVTFGQSPRCLLWGWNLMDMESNYTTGQDIFIRLAKDELDDLNVGGADKNKHLVAILVPTAAAGLLIFVMFVYFIWRRHKRQGRREAEMGFRAFINGDSIPDLPLFSFTGILAATENFSTANKLGEGGFGPVYKGKLPKGREVAIKRLSKTSGQGLEEFKNEVELIAKLQHKNLVRLLGWCIHGHEKILIYEFMANKSLDKFLFDPTGQLQLDWGRRFCIAEGIAQGLLYLHRYSRLRVIHRDLKPSNILLDSAMNPKISDFGLARIFGGNQTVANTNRVVGTYGYMSPEYALDGLFSEKSDVFSFGVILLEIVSGKRSTGFYPFKHSLNLLGYAWLLWREDRSSELLDPTILDSCIIHEVSRCIHVGLLCVQEDARDRPDMSSVVCMLNNHRATLPSPKQPAFSVSKAPASSDSSSSSASMYFSINDVTITTLGPR